MRFSLIDLKLKGKAINRDHTGTFGSYMHAGGLFGALITYLKRTRLNLPLTIFGNATAILRPKGHRVDFLQEIPAENYDVAIFASSMHAYKEEVSAARELKRKFPQMKIGFVNAFSTIQPELFEEAADFVVIGELESVLFSFLEGKHKFEGRLDNGKIEEMDKIPIPDWRGFPLNTYGYFPLLPKKPFLTVQSSRGCPYNCKFCPYMVVQQPEFRPRTPSLVVDEIEKNYRDHGTQSFLFRDICFTFQKDHSLRIASELIARKLNFIEWGCETRVDCLDNDLIDQLFEAGMRGVNLGIETGSTETQKKSGKKPPNMASQEEIISYLQKKKVRINGFYMLGLISDTAQSMKETIKYSHHLNTFGAQYCVMTPFPGTKLFDELEKDLITKDWSRFNEYDPVIDIRTASPSEVIHQRNKAYQRYYIRPRWLAKYGLSVVKTLMNTFL